MKIFSEQKGTNGGIYEDISTLVSSNLLTIQLETIPISMASVVVHHSADPGSSPGNDRQEG